MDSKATRRRFCKGISLIDAIIAIAVLAIAILGTSSFRYFTALEAHQAALRSDAARLALMLCESWKGVAGSETYDPVTSLSDELSIAEAEEGPEPPDDFTPVSVCAVELDDGDFYVTLSYQDIETGLRALNVIISWAQRVQEDEAGFDAVDKSFELTTYVMN